jgi:O-antigen/teichoic acid export membrane protein
MQDPNSIPSESAPIPEARRPLMSVVSVGVTLASLGLSRLAFNIVGNHSFGVATVGRANVLLSIALLVGLPASAGIAPALSRFIPIYAGGRETWQALRMSIPLALGVVVLAVTAVLTASRAGLVAEAGWSDLALITSWAIVYAAYALGRALLFAQGRIRTVLYLELLGLSSFGIALAAAATSRGWWIPFLVYPVPTAASLFVTALRHPVRGPLPNGSAFLAFAALALVGSIASLGIQYGSTLVSAAAGGTIVAGIWATLVSAASPVLLFPRSLSTLYLPRLAAECHPPGAAFGALTQEHERMARMFAILATFSLLAFGAVGIGLAIPGGATREISVAWCLLSLVSYATCRGEPLLTTVAALGFAGVNASSSLLATPLCVATWVGFGKAGHQLLGVASGMLVFAVAVPAFSFALVTFRSVRGRPRVTAHAADFAVVIAVLAMMASRGHDAIELAALGIGLLALGMEGLASWPFLRAEIFRR